MRVVKNLNKQYNEYFKSSKRELSQCYNNYSIAKGRAFDYCLELVLKYQGGVTYRIISYNQTMFTFGFIGQYEGKKAFFYITKDYDRVMLLED